MENCLVVTDWPALRRRELYADFCKEHGYTHPRYAKRHPGLTVIHGISKNADAWSSCGLNRRSDDILRKQKAAKGSGCSVVLSDTTIVKDGMIEHSPIVFMNHHELNEKAVFIEKCTHGFV